MMFITLKYLNNSPLHIFTNLMHTNYLDIIALYFQIFRIVFWKVFFNTLEEGIKCDFMNKSQ